MARPKLPDDERRTKTIGVRVSPVELDVLTQKAAIAGTDPSGLLRAAGIAGEIPPPPVPAVNLAEYGRLGHLAANVNQLAAAANATGQIDPVALASVLGDVGAEIRRLRFALLGQAGE
jgi:hypothetical protein